MRILLAFVIGMTALFSPLAAIAQWPEGFLPAGEYQPDYPGGIRAARIVFSNLERSKGSIAFSAYEFESDQTASAAMGQVVDNYKSTMADIWKTEPHIDPVSSRDLGGDEQLVLAGSLRSGIGDERVVAEAIAVVRRGNLLWVGVGTRYDEATPLYDVLDVLQRIVERRPDGQAILTETGWGGGLFAMLPTLSDLPEGYTHTEILRAIATPVGTPSE